MTVRSRQTRRDWWPAQRIPQLKRYAFIGDSTMYGAGVKPDETMPAFAERQLNEALPAWPVEAVNYGVSGYNIWNSWVGIKPLLPLFDGLVLALCSNDAEMFSRTYHVGIPDGRYASWEPQDPFGAAAAACFADIARCCKALALPVMVVFSNPNKLDRQIRVNEIIAGYCADHGLGYIHTLPLFAARNLTPAQTVISAADGHPTALAHDLAARHLVSEMARLRWFVGADEKTGELAPARISQCVETMMAVEHYPADAALAWALGAMEAKTRVARRRAALEGADLFEPTAAPVRAVLQAESEAWHLVRRAEACVLELANQSQAFSWVLVALQTSRLRLEEIGFALAAPETLPALARLPPPPAIKSPPASQPPASFAQTRAVIATEMAALIKLSQLSNATEIAIKPLLRFLALLDAETLAVEGAVAHANMLAATNGGTLPPAQRGLVLAQLEAEIDTVGNNLTKSRTMARWPARLTNQQTPPYTKITAVLRTSMRNGAICIFTVRADYTVPHRLTFVSHTMFHTDPQPITLHFVVPLLYAGRVTLCNLGIPRSPAPDVVEILELTVSNEPGVKRSISPTFLHLGERASWVSPLVFMV